MNIESKNESIVSSKTRHYLVFSFAVIIILAIISNSISFKHLNSVQNNVIKIIETQNAQIDFMHKMRSIARERIIKLHTLVASEDKFEHENIITEFHQLGGIFLETRLSLKKTDLTKEELTLLKIQRNIARRVVASQYKVIELVEEEAYQEALDYLVKKTVPIQNENMSFMDQFILYQNHQNQVLKSEANKKVQSAYTIVIVLTTLSILLTIIVAAVAIKHITKIITLLSESVQDHKKTAEQLVHAHNILEHKVSERTKELQEANQSLKHIAGHDSLTDLPNRRLFSELLTQETHRAKRNFYDLAILYMDLDGILKRR